MSEIQVMAIAYRLALKRLSSLLSTPAEDLTSHFIEQAEAMIAKASPTQTECIVQQVMDEFGRPGDPPMVAAGNSAMQFLRDLELLQREQLNVATNYSGTEDRPCLSLELRTTTGSGYLIALRMDGGAPRYMEAMAKDLHEGIQEYFKAAEAMEQS